MGDIRPTCSWILELVGTAFVCGVVFLAIQIVVFDSYDINRMLGELMLVSLIVLPTALSVAISYFCHRNMAYATVTGVVTLVFVVIVLRAVAIGHAF
ncbi:MAG: hypothetical protein U9N36_07145 [Euryarchaeota archaeon]|nr:hypothetical protein [Euryarchaeota archaeon]